LILCDHCERETHTYCLEPPLAAVPDTDPWYCQSCTAEGVPEREAGEGDDDGEGVCSSIFLFAVRRTFMQRWAVGDVL
jgi:hypothetical protein